MNDRPKTKTIIIGSGVAGMSAAVETAGKPNQEVLVLEKAGRIGGRCFSFYDDKSGLLFDNGQHVMINAYTNFLHLIEQLGTSNLLINSEAINVPFRLDDKSAGSFDCSKYHGKIGHIAGLFGLKNISLFDKLKLLKFILSLNSIKNIENESAEILLLKSGQSKDLIKYFWEPVVLAVLNAKIETASAQVFVNTLKIVFNGKANASALIFPLSGLSNLFDPFEEYLNKRGSKLILNSKVDKLYIENNKIQAVETAGTILECDNVICTLPPNSLQTLFIKSNIAYSLYNFEYSTIVSAYLIFNVDFIEDKFIGLLDSKLHWVFNKSKIQKSKSSGKGFYSITISAAEELSKLPNRDIEQIILAEFERHFPESKNVTLERIFVMADRRATIKLNADAALHRANTDTSIQGLYLAGDWTNTGLPATIESASESGIRAAHKIIS